MIWLFIGKKIKAYEAFCNILGVAVLYVMMKLAHPIAWTVYRLAIAMPVALIYYAITGVNFVLALPYVALVFFFDR